MDMSGDDLSALGASLRALSGQYDQASRAASSL
jgi:predicted MarR family transcription regulator